MSDQDDRGPDWSAVFNRAHRRVARRLLLFGAIGVVGALFLLNGGLAASGTVSWNLKPAKHEKKSKKPPRPHPPVAPEEPPGGPSSNPPGQPRPHPPPRPPRTRPPTKTPSCADPDSFNSLEEYEEECPPNVTGPDGGGEDGKTSTGESGEKG